MRATRTGDITGNGFSAMFAKAPHLKAVDHSKPRGSCRCRLGGARLVAGTTKGQRSNLRKGTVWPISGRGSPGCSVGLAWPLQNLQATGRAVIGVLGTRIGHALEESTDLRRPVFARDMNGLMFFTFEREFARFFRKESTAWPDNGTGRS